MTAQPRRESSLNSNLTLKERQNQERISALTGPKGLAEIPARTADGEPSYVGMSDDELWRHLLDSRQIAIVGIKERNSRRGHFAGRSLVAADTLEKARTTLLKKSAEIWSCDLVDSVSHTIRPAFVWPIVVPARH